MESKERVPIEIGDKVTFSKTVGETDVYMFAGITGDFAPNHVNEEYMNKTPYKKRIAHGVLSIGFASTTSSLFFEKVDTKGMGAVSYGYDRIRFIQPIFIGDTVTVHYTIAEIDHENLKSIAEIEIYNQNNEICTAGQHILKFIKE
ncbi:MaoC family dehydratase N-terminal domain-containing protein [Salicibibacter cibarius]|uniref:MaoC family dehydratase N-terminal domain-containing protein n=1 Tax=Salicibibacter cibarius TaxID=2743000 RepID=A0A7T6Z6A6_9BACI|nr:MaoC/PaaZ C-terminal domain-containing protein [Salicibibacter cibarius]QQK77775.1 MaoC family dehydratase N-terminal domain-containing protein [Salicibibacter cibarius]